MIAVALGVISVTCIPLVSKLQLAVHGSYQLDRNLLAGAMALQLTEPHRGNYKQN